ncbi:hypothetical protein VTH82DRAFT_7382 [Thermothelomyces myriococcoides]
MLLYPQCRSLQPARHARVSTTLSLPLVVTLHQQTGG